MRGRRSIHLIAALLFFGGWGAWFAVHPLGFALMGAGALSFAVVAVRDMRADGSSAAARAWREQSRQMRATAGSSTGGWLGGGDSGSCGSGGLFGGGDGGGGGLGGGDGGGGGGC